MYNIVASRVQTRRYKRQIPRSLVTLFDDIFINISWQKITSLQSSYWYWISFLIDAMHFETF